MSNYRITPGLECLFGDDNKLTISAKAKKSKKKSKKDNKDNKEVDVDIDLLTDNLDTDVDADLADPLDDSSVGSPLPDTAIGMNKDNMDVISNPKATMSVEEILKIIDTDVDKAAAAYMNLSDEDKAAVRAAVAQKAEIDKRFDAAVKIHIDAVDTVKEENQQMQEAQAPVAEDDNDVNENIGSNLGNNDTDYNKARVNNPVSGEEPLLNDSKTPKLPGSEKPVAGTPDLGGISAGIKEQLKVEADYHVKNELPKSTYLTSIASIYNSKKITAAASVIYDLAKKEKTPSTLGIKAEKINNFLIEANAYKNYKPVAEDLDVAKSCDTGTDWLYKLASTDTFLTKLHKEAAQLGEKPAGLKQHPGQKMFDNGMSTQEAGMTPEQFPGKKVFEKTNTQVETVFPEGQITVDDVTANRTIIEKKPQIKDKDNVTIAIMQPITVKNPPMGTSSENNMQGFWFNGNNMVMTPKPDKEALPTGKPAHVTPDFNQAMAGAAKTANAKSNLKIEAEYNQSGISADGNSIIIRGTAEEMNNLEHLLKDQGIYTNIETDDGGRFARIFIDLNTYAEKPDLKAKVINVKKAYTTVMAGAKTVAKDLASGTVQGVKNLYENVKNRWNK